MKIVLVGDSGTGKSTLAKALVKRLRITHRSVGDFFREMAEEKGMPMLELEKLFATDPAHDFELDRRTTEFGKSAINFVYDGRLAAECIPDAFKVLLHCRDEVRWQRVADTRGLTYEQAVRQTQTRESIYAERFKRCYGIDDFRKPKNYSFDLSIDTEQASTDACTDMVVEGLRVRGICFVCV